MMMLADACMYAVVLGLIGKVKLAVTTNFNINFLHQADADRPAGQRHHYKTGRAYWRCWRYQS